jgi:predicted DsbA family dithiol-disulfide isomerase
MKTVNVQVWSDIVCPWCWIAKRRLDRAITEVAGQIEVTITPRAYRLARGMAPIDYRQAIQAKFGNRAAADRMMAAVSQNGRAEGLIYNFATMRFGDTQDAHALIKSIRDPELAARVTERVYKAATTEGIDIFDRAALLKLATEAGATDLEVDFDSRHIATEIARDESKGKGISNGVPLFVFNNGLYLSGAQPAAMFRKALVEVAIDTDQAFGGGAVCTVDGCA